MEEIENKFKEYSDEQVLNMLLLTMIGRKQPFTFDELKDEILSRMNK